MQHSQQITFSVVEKSFVLEGFHETFSRQQIHHDLAFVAKSVQVKKRLGSMPDHTGAALEMVGLGMVMPTMSILINPESIGELGLPTALQNGLESFSKDRLIVVVMLALLITYTVKGLYLGLLNWIQATFAYSIKATLSDDLLSTYVNADHEFHLLENSATLIRNITIEVEQFISHVLVPTIRLISELFIVIAILSSSHLRQSRRHRLFGIGGWRINARFPTFNAKAGYSPGDVVDRKLKAFVFNEHRRYWAA